jgi:capsular polysaccharide transport system ATP-binding protein
MIHLIDVSKHYRGELGVKTVLKPTSLSIPTDRRLGILGANGAGKSTLLKLIAGSELPSKGRIVRESTVSWPLGFSGGVHGELTGAQNVAFIARINGMNIDDAVEFVKDFSELGRDFYNKVKTYSTGMRARLNFGLSMAIDFDCYLIDEIIGVGDAPFQKKCREAFLERAERRGFLLVSHSDRAIRMYCEAAIVLFNRTLVPFETLDEAVFFYRRVMPT